MPSEKNAEESLRYFLILWTNIAPHIKRGMESNYGKDFERILSKNIHELFEQVAAELNIYERYDLYEAQLFIRYHSYAVLGILYNWSDEDTKNLDMIAYNIYRLLSGKIDSLLPE